MTKILSVSDLKNYNEVLKNCHKGEPIYLTENDKVRVVVMDSEDYVRDRAEKKLLMKLQKAEEAVKDGEVVSLSAQLSAVDQCVSDLEGLSVPDAMGDIHSSYVNGAKELQTALSSYVQLYEDVKAPANGVAPSGADYDSRMAEIQSHYDAGIKALQDADSKAESA